jgi:hypothetical protein
VPKNEPEVDQKKPPEFTRRWWYSSRRLDARPLAWSLVNRPHEWAWSSQNLIVHMPSTHIYWIGTNQKAFQYDAPYCNCQSASRGRFQRGQQRMFRNAFNTWKASHPRD